MPTEQVQEEKKEEKKEKKVDNQEPMVDIDTSGPGAEVELPEEKTKQVEVTDEKPIDEVKTPDEKPIVQEDKKDEANIQEDKKTEDKQELDEYSEGVKKRIAKLTKKMREAERQKEAAIDYAKGVQAESTALKKKVSTLEPGYMKAMESKVTSGLQAAQAQLVAAREAGDIKAEVDAQKAIAKLGLEEARVEVMKQRANTNAKEKPVESKTLDQAIASKEQVDPKADAWADRNEWFGKDSAMTYTAFDYHKKLTEQEGFDPNSDEYYAEIDKRMRLDFPHKFDKTESTVTTKPTQTVASAKRSVNTGRKTVRLTPSQVTIAKKLGVPLEEYAKQLRITKEV